LSRLALPFVGGASLCEPGTGRGWVLDDRGSIGSLGAALVWAGRHQVRELHLLVDGAAASRREASRMPGAGSPYEAVVGAVITSGSGSLPPSGAPADGESVDGGSVEGAGVAGVLARRARLWAEPPTVWTVAGRGLVAAEPAPLPVPVEPPAAAREWIGVLSEHGAEVVVEGGVITGAVLGLEVARVVANRGGPGWHVEVGVGRHDREATLELRRDEPLDEALERVVSVVRRLRVAGAARGPANTLARERWLRSVVMARPELVGAARLEAVSPPVVRRDLIRPAPASAAGVDLDGSPMVAVCSVGVDPDLVPTAADTRDLLERTGALSAGAEGQSRTGETSSTGGFSGGFSGARKTRLVLVVPEGDDYPVTRELAAALAEPAEIAVVPRDWANLV